MIIIVLGVPRSGTTLLRVLLGAHSQIVAAPETPWIAGGYGRNSMRQFAEFCIQHVNGPTRYLDGITEDVVYNASRRFVVDLLDAYIRNSGKPHGLLKTPDDCGKLDFLLRMFPDSSYVHITRDGRDVACSTIAKRGEFIGPELLGYGENSLGNAMQRWCDWERAVRAAIADGRIQRSILVTYERLVAAPEETVARICDFLGVQYEAGMVEYHTKQIDLPEWEQGTHDLRLKGTIDTASIGRWRRELTWDEMLAIDERFGDELVALGYGRCADEIDPSSVQRTRSVEAPSKIRRFWQVSGNLLRMAPTMPVRAVRAMAWSVKNDLQQAVNGNGSN